MQGKYCSLSSWEMLNLRKYIYIYIQYIGEKKKEHVCQGRSTPYIESPTFTRNPYKMYINPYYWTDELIPYGNHGSFSPWILNKIIYLLGGFNFQPWKICASQIGSFPQIGGFRKKIFETTNYRYWSENHHQFTSWRASRKALGRGRGTICERLSSSKEPKVWTLGLPCVSKICCESSVLVSQQGNGFRLLKAKSQFFLLNQVFWLVLRLWDTESFLNI